MASKSKQDSAPEESFSELKDDVDAMTRDREVSENYFLSIITDFRYARKQLWDWRSRYEAKNRLLTTLGKSFIQMNKNCEAMQKQINRNSSLAEQEEMNITQLQVEYNKLEARHTAAAADPMVNHLINTERRFESHSDPNNVASTIMSLHAELEKKQEEKQNMEKELALHIKTIRCLKSNLQNYLVPAVTTISSKPALPVIPALHAKPALPTLTIDTDST